MKDWIDLSQPYFTNMPRGGVLKASDLSTVCLPSLHPDPGGRVRITELFTPVHVGTHVDAPSHYFEGGANIDDLPLERFYGTGVVLDLPREPLETITIEDLERASPGIRRGDIVFLRTGWGSKFAVEQAAEYRKHPYLVPEVADWLIDAGVRMLGVDTISPDQPADHRPDDYRMDIHVKLLRAGVLIAENMNLSALAGVRCTIAAFPLNISCGDGAPARIVATPD